MPSLLFEDNKIYSQSVQFLCMLLRAILFLVNFHFFICLGLLHCVPPTWRTDSAKLFLTPSLSGIGWDGMSAYSSTALFIELVICWILWSFTSITNHYKHCQYQDINGTTPEDWPKKVEKIQVIPGWFTRFLCRYRQHCHLSICSSVTPRHLCRQY